MGSRTYSLFLSSRSHNWAFIYSIFVALGGFSFYRWISYFLLSTLVKRWVVDDQQLNLSSLPRLGRLWHDQFQPEYLIRRWQLVWRLGIWFQVRHHVWQHSLLHIHWTTPYWGCARDWSDDGGSFQVKRRKHLRLLNWHAPKGGTKSQLRLKLST